MTTEKPGNSVRAEMVTYVRELQERNCVSVENEDASAKFTEDRWERPGGGGGITRVLAGGSVFEKAGVNTSTVFGELPSTIAAKMNVERSEFFATGISLVLHPSS